MFGDAMSVVWPVDAQDKEVGDSALDWNVAAAVDIEYGVPEHLTKEQADEMVKQQLPHARANASYTKVWNAGVVQLAANQKLTEKTRIDRIDFNLHTLFDLSSDDKARISIGWYTPKSALSVVSLFLLVHCPSGDDRNRTFSSTVATPAAAATAATFAWLLHTHAAAAGCLFVSTVYFWASSV